MRRPDGRVVFDRRARTGRGGVTGAALDLLLRGTSVLAVAVLLALALSSCTAATTMPSASSGDPASLRRQLSANDNHLVARTIQTAMERRGDNEPSTWINDLIGNYGMVVPRVTFRPSSGTHCPLYEETLTVSGMAATFEHTACGDGAGRWISLT